MQSPLLTNMKKSKRQTFTRENKTVLKSTWKPTLIILKTKVVTCEIMNLDGAQFRIIISTITTIHVLPGGNLLLVGDSAKDRCSFPSIRSRLHPKSKTYTLKWTVNLYVQHVPTGSTHVVKIYCPLFSNWGRDIRITS